jgi:transcriptional regulator with XRE-family HTH domain
MKLREYLRLKNLSLTSFAKMVAKDKTRISKQAISGYADGVNSPSLEVSLLICRATDGQVEPHELLTKRRFSQDHDPIAVSLGWEFPDVDYEDLL